jgi:FkbM family methyltransferase
LSTNFFANKFPDAKIIAVEPNPSNFTLLKENTFNYPNIKLINSGIWNIRALLKIRIAGQSYWETEVEEATNIQEEIFEAVTIGELLISSGFKEIDILKLDIEGSEKIIFSSGYEGWLDKVNNIIIELHDRFQAGCSETVYAALKYYNIINYDKGENTIFINKS